MTTSGGSRDALEIARGIPLFSQVADRDLEQIASHLIERRFPRNTTIVETSDVYATLDVTAFRPGAGSGGEDVVSQSTGRRFLPRSPEDCAYDADGNLVQADQRPIVLLWVHWLVVIDAGDAVLVSSLERSAEVRKVVSQLRKRGRSDLI